MVCFSQSETITSVWLIRMFMVSVETGRAGGTNQREGERLETEATKYKSVTAYSV